jgi:hypothetical protein
MARNYERMRMMAYIGWGFGLTGWVVAGILLSVMK